MLDFAPHLYMRNRAALDTIGEKKRFGGGRELIGAERNRCIIGSLQGNAGCISGLHERF